MADHETYYRYLKRRSVLGLLYRRWLLYPRICRRLQGKVLDVGCGIGDMLSFRTGTVGVDVNPLLVEHCRSRGVEAHLSQSDRLPFRDQSFDGALLDNVLEHLADPRAVLSEIGRVLVPRGRLVVGVPGRRGYQRDSDHKVFYDEESLVRCLAASGFAVTDMFVTPFRSRVLDRVLRQYCVYGVFAWTRADLASSASGSSAYTPSSATAPNHA